MKYLKTYPAYLSEGAKISIDQLKPGDEVSYKRNNGTTTTKRISRIDYDNGKVYFTDNKMKEFSKSIADVLKIKG